MLRIIYFFAFIFCLASCEKSSHSGPKPIALVSIAPYQYLVERVGGDRLQVQTIVPSGANPHSFEPTAKQVQNLSQGTIWFRIGEPFEEKIIPILKERNESLEFLDLREGLDLMADASSLTCHDCAMEHLDRHIWMSPTLAAVQVEAIVQTLSDSFPEFAPEFKQKGAVLVQELMDLDLEIRHILKPVKKRFLLVSHPAFGYFCRDYQIEQISVEYEGKDPRPHHLEEILKTAITHSLDFTLALPQYNNKGAQVIAEKLHVPVKWIDPYSPDYFDMMRHLARLIAEKKDD